MSKIEYRGDMEEVVRAVLQVVENLVRAGKPPGPERAKAFVPNVLSQLRTAVSQMSAERAESILANVDDQIGDLRQESVELHGDFTDEQLDAIVFLMHRAGRSARFR